VTSSNRSLSQGSRPAGIDEEKAAARYVRDLFSRIAGRYDLLNHLLSFQMDRYWRGVLARRFRARMASPASLVLDLCCGTGDQAIALAAFSPQSGGARIVACDFSHPMLTRAAAKFRARGRAGSPAAFVAEADALQLPFAAGSFDLVVCSFGFRNLANYRAGLAEIHRVLRNGGELGILDFSEPRGLLRPFYSFYFHQVLPRVGEWISGVRGSYSYLPRSVDRFPDSAEVLAWLDEAGFSDAAALPLTGGITILYSALKRGSQLPDGP